MKALVRDAMHDGAVGVSTSLQYAPAPYATTEELIALAAEAGKFGGIYATHMRSEGDAIMAAIDEAIRIGREGQSAGRDLASQSGRQAELGAHAGDRRTDRECRAPRRRVSARTPTRIPPGSISFSAFIPPWAHDGGDAKLIERLKDPATRARIRKDMQTPSDRLGQRMAGDSRP